MGKPKIRFKGFDDDWEQRKLGEITVKIGSGKTPSGGKSAYVETGIPLIRSQNVNNDKVDFADVVYIDKSTDESMSNSRVYTNDVLLNITGASIGRSAVYKGVESANVNQHVCIIRQIEGYQSDFIQLNLSSDNGQKQIDASQAGGGREGLNFQEIGKMQFSFPTLNEQKCIGRYFNNLDHLITLHQRKCDETKKLKKYMLQKMFPQNGQTVPEIRFSGFTDVWEQRKVTDLGEIYISLVTTMTEHYTDKGHLLIRNSDIKDGYFEFGENPIYLDEEFSEQNKSRMHQLGDVITVHTGDIGTSAVIGENEVNSIGFATIVTRPNQEILDSNYFATYLNTDTHKQWAISMATGDGRSNYNLKDYTKLVVPIPEIEEQKKIATCIVNLNSLITLHQQKCDELRNIKKFMLQNMFA